MYFNRHNSTIRSIFECIAYKIDHNFSDFCSITHYILMCYAYFALNLYIFFFCDRFEHSTYFFQYITQSFNILINFHLSALNTSHIKNIIDNGQQKFS